MASLLHIVLLPLFLFFLLSLLASAFLYLHSRRRSPLPSPDLLKQPLVTTHTWQEIQAMTHNFSTTVIAHGGFSTVYLTSTTPTSAVKVHNASERLHSAFLRELHALLRLRHVAIVTLTGFSDNGDQGALVFEYVPNGTLHEKLHEGGGDGSPLSWPHRMRIALQLASALEYLHEGCELQVVHGDLKPSNVLLDVDFNCKLCDFGSAMMGFSSTVERQRAMVGSVGYVDPYYVRTGVVSKKSDVYSFGVVVLEMLTGKEAFCEEGGEGLVKAVASELREGRVEGLVDERLEGRFDEVEARAVAEVVGRCFGEDPSGRPGMGEVVRVLREKLRGSISAVERGSKGPDGSLHSQWRSFFIT